MAPKDRSTGTGGSLVGRRRLRSLPRMLTANRRDSNPRTKISEIILPVRRLVLQPERLRLAGWH
jgi:hypothetical protein